MALGGRDDNRARRLRGAVKHCRTPELRIQFHGIVGQKSRLIADVRILRIALRDRKHQTGEDSRHPDQVPKLDHAKLSSLAVPAYVHVWQSLEPSNRRAGAMASNP